MTITVIATGFATNRDLVAVTVNSTGANAIIASASCLGAAAPISDLVGGNSNTYTNLTAYGAGGGVPVAVRISYVLSPIVGSVHVVSATFSGGFMTLGVLAASGVASFTGESGALNGSNTISPGTATGVAGSLNITNLSSDDLGGGSPYATIDSSFTIWGSSPVVAFVSYPGAHAYKISGTETPTWTNPNTASSEGSALAWFAPSGGGGGNVVSGGATEGADATSGSIKVAVKASGGVTEGKDATSGTIKLASKVSGGATEGPDATAGSVKVALKVSGGVTEGADFTTGAISVGSTHVSGNLTEGADATGGGSIKVALHLSGGPTEGKDATAGNLLVAVKASGGVTEGADAISGSITATSRTISGGFTEGADRTSGIIISGTVSQGGHFLPLTKKEIAEARKRAKAARDKEEAGWDQAAKDKAELHQQIMKTLHPEKILGTGKIQTPEEDDDEADIEMLLLYG